MNTYIVAWTVGGSHIKMEPIIASTMDIAITEALGEDNITGATSIHFKTLNEMRKWYLDAGISVNVLRVK